MDNRKIYTLWFRMVKLGTVVHEYSDFPNECGRFERRPTLDDSKDGELMESYINYLLASAQLGEEGKNTSELDRQYANQLPAILDTIESNDWCLIDGDGNEKRITAPNIQLESGIVWRWNMD